MDKDEDIDIKKDSELSGLIKDTLAGYKEEYVAGAWENFTNKRRIISNKRKRVVFLRYAAGVAACFILGLIGLNVYKMQTTVKTEQLGQIVKNKESETETITENGEKTLTETRAKKYFRKAKSGKRGKCTLK